ncbi:Uncharacterised protein [Legionella pneumophila]|nr:hypothetical protein ULM_18900 [Legionella pneumophila]CZG11569.1 Uncharacterised protein [Legionella pneumophila]CZG13914.1 Uncharacterised protein [Legionella pneumophila]CZG44166.1 Uncharacterised protein [Legionella pneumophila]CZG44332.1 Uncharacterised protein [Legionella pneumophila]
MLSDSGGEEIDVYYEGIGCSHGRVYQAESH